MSSSPPVSDKVLAAFRLHLQQRNPTGAFVPDLTGDKLSFSIIEPWGDTFAGQTFAIHESLLDRHGTLLSLASQSSDLEPPYKLTDFSIRSFALYVTWLYERQLRVTKLPSEEEKEKFEKLGEAFALGYCIQEMDFQIAVVDEMLKLAQEVDGFPGYELTDVVYRCYDCDALRGLIVDLWAWKATARWRAVDDVEGIACDELDHGNLERMFAIDLCKALVRVRPVPGQKVSATEKKPWENARKYYMHILEQTWGEAGARYQKNLLEAMGERKTLEVCAIGKD